MKISDVKAKEVGEEIVQFPLQCALYKVKGDQKGIVTRMGPHTRGADIVYVSGTIGFLQNIAKEAISQGHPKESAEIQEIIERLTDILQGMSNIIIELEGSDNFKIACHEAHKEAERKGVKYIFGDGFPD